jgi:hypothetical protein
MKSTGEESVSFCKCALASRIESRGEYLDLKEREPAVTVAARSKA